MIYKNKLFSKVDLVIGIDHQYYRTYTYMCNGFTDMIDMFPSIGIASFADCIYVRNTGEFTKFRDEPKNQIHYEEFFKHGAIKRVTLYQIINLIEERYDTKIKLWNNDKWMTLLTQESVQDEFQDGF